MLNIPLPIPATHLQLHVSPQRMVIYKVNVFLIPIGNPKLQKPLNALKVLKSVFSVLFFFNFSRNLSFLYSL